MTTKSSVDWVLNGVRIVKRAIKTLLGQNCTVVRISACKKIHIEVFRSEEVSHLQFTLKLIGYMNILCFYIFIIKQ